MPPYAYKPPTTAQIKAATWTPITTPNAPKQSSQAVVSKSVYSTSGTNAQQNKQNQSTIVERAGEQSFTVKAQEGQTKFVASSTKLVTKTVPFVFGANEKPNVQSAPMLKIVTTNSSPIVSQYNAYVAGGGTRAPYAIKTPAEKAAVYVEKSNLIEQQAIAKYNAEHGTNLKAPSSKLKASAIGNAIQAQQKTLEKKNQNLLQEQRNLLPQQQAIQNKKNVLANELLLIQQNESLAQKRLIAPEVYYASIDAYNLKADELQKDVDSFNNKNSDLQMKNIALQKQASGLAVLVPMQNIQAIGADESLIKKQKLELQKEFTGSLEAGKYPKGFKEIPNYMTTSGKEAAKGTANFLSGLTGGLINPMWFGAAAVPAWGLVGLSSGVGGLIGVGFNKAFPKQKGEISSIVPNVPTDILSLEKMSGRKVTPFEQATWESYLGAQGISVAYLKRGQEAGLKQVPVTTSERIAGTGTFIAQTVLTGAFLKPFIVTPGLPIAKGISKLDKILVNKGILKPQPDIVESLNIRSNQFISENKALGKDDYLKGIYDYKTDATLISKSGDKVLTKNISLGEAGKSIQHPTINFYEGMSKAENRILKVFGIERPSVEEQFVLKPLPAKGFTTRLEQGSSSIGKANKVTVFQDTMKPFTEPLTAEGKVLPGQYYIEAGQNVRSTAFYGTEAKPQGIFSQMRQRVVGSYEITPTTAKAIIGSGKNLRLFEPTSKEFVSARLYATGEGKLMTLTGKEYPFTSTTITQRYIFTPNTSEAPTFVFGRHIEETGLLKPIINQIKSLGGNVKQIPAKFSRIAETGDRPAYDAFLKKTYGSNVIDLHTEQTMPGGTFNTIQTKGGITILETPTSAGVQSKEFLGNFMQTISKNKMATSLIQDTAPQISASAGTKIEAGFSQLSRVFESQRVGFGSGVTMLGALTIGAYAGQSSKISKSSIIAIPKINMGAGLQTIQITKITGTTKQDITPLQKITSIPKQEQSSIQNIVNIFQTPIVEITDIVPVTDVPVSPIVSVSNLVPGLPLFGGGGLNLDISSNRNKRKFKDVYRNELASALNVFKKELKF